ncbi:hypothetical protein BTO28_12340 [Domibacillus epiphyticus]|uniref:Uncharacterized protein n=2 Tax=Domibacillus epiphyticus TaxID=1714355 RepID=A0A1V2A6H5_9BACI|nr:hypothetical protein BTO28_12340 [Domibacillus epiphyticus]
MTYKEVQRLVGGTGSVGSESGFNSHENHYLSIIYDGVAPHSYASLIFSNGTVSSKTEYGLK